MKMKKRLLSILLSLVLVLGLMPGMSMTAYASETWSSTSTTIDSTRTIEGGVTVTADITLTIPEGKTLTVNGGINASGHTLTVTGGGTLIVNGSNGVNGGYEDPGGKGGNGIVGNIIVSGASVTVTGGAGGAGGAGDPAGDGGTGGCGVSGSVTVNSGSITVTGGNGGTGGHRTYGNSAGGDGGTGGCGVSGSVTVNSGSITVTGGSGGEGAGDGGNAGQAVSGTITGTTAQESEDNSSWSDISGGTSSKKYVKVEGAAATDSYTSLKNTTTVVHFDSKDWYLIDYDDSTVTLLAKECVGASPFNPENGGNTYSGSSVKTVVDTYYTNNISTAAQAAVSGSGMFLLTTDQAMAISDANVNVLKCTKADGADYNSWWLCSQGDDANYAACVIGGNGTVFDRGYRVNTTRGVRPALKLDLSKVTFDSTSKTFTVGSAETSETLLTTITRNNSGAVYSVSGRATLSTSGNVKDDWDPISDVHGWVNTSQQIGSVTITAEAGYTITKVVFWDYDVEDGYCDALTDNASPFTCYMKGSWKSLNEEVSYDEAGSICKIDVYGYPSATVNVTGVTLDKTDTQTIDVGGSVAFTATVAPDGATDKKVKWSVGGTNASAVTLYSDSNCTSPITTGTAISTLTVYAKGTEAGSATVTVTTNDGDKTASCNVTVNAAPPYASLKNTTTVVHFDSKDWYLIDYDDSTVTLLAKECVGASKFNNQKSDGHSYNGSVVEKFVNDWYTNDNNISAGAKAAVSGSGMFLLTTDQATAISNANVNVLKCSQATGAEYDYWWLCSPGGNDDVAACVLGDIGFVYDYGAFVDYTLGVRPALQLDLSKVTFDSTSKTFTVGAAETSYTVTYKVVGGTWSDGTTADKTETVASGSKPASEPTGMKASEGYTGGSWDTDPTNATITEATTFTYTFTAKSDQTAPTGLAATKASSSTAADGKISGVTDAMEYQKDGDSTWTAVEENKTEITGLPAGTYKVRYAGTEDKNASPETTVVVGVKVAPTVTAPTAKTLTYNGQAQELVTAGETDGGTMQYALGTATEATEQYTTSIPKATNAGTYYVWYMVAGDSDHGDTEPVCISVEISKLEAVLDWVKTTLPYTGEAQLPKVIVKNRMGNDDIEVELTGAKKEVGYYTATFVKLTGDDAGNYEDPTADTERIYSITKSADNVSVTMADWTYGGVASEPVVKGITGNKPYVIEYKVYGANNSTYVPGKPSTAGTYNIRVTVEGDATSETVSAEDSFTILPRRVSLDWGSKTFVYNGKDQKPTVEITNLVEGDKCDLTVVGAATAVGTHTATVTKLSNANYELPENSSVEFTITKAKIELPEDQGDSPATITMPSWTYGDDAPEPVVKNNISNGQVKISYMDLTNLEGDPVFTTAKPKNAGIYLIKAEISATENYDGAEIWSYFQILPRAAELSWSDTSFIYDGKDHVPTCQVTNLVNGDKCEVTVEGETANVGEHEAVAAELSNKNYELPTTVTQIFTISKDKPALTVSQTGWTYGDKAKEPAVEGNTGNAEVTYTYYTDKECSKKTATTDGAAADGKVPAKAGTYYVQAVAAETAGYEGDSAVAEFTIEKKALSIEWTDTSLTYNGAAQTPKAAAINKVGEDELTLNVDGAQKDAGEYEATVTLSGAAADNYVLSEMTVQRFKIAKKAAELKWGDKTTFVYNGADQIPTVEITNLEEGDKCDLTVVGAATAVGTHTATVTRLSNANYELPEDASVEFTIIKADVQTGEDPATNPATLTMANWTYGDSAPEPVLTNNIGGGTVTYDYADISAIAALDSFEDLEYDTPKPVNAGAYVVRAQIGATENYNDATLYSIFVIMPRIAEFDWSEFSFVYDGEEHIPVCVVSNLVGNDECEVTLTGATAEVGSHTAEATELSNNNYMMPGSVTQNFTISKDVPVLTVSQTGWTYGDEAKEPAVEGNTGNAEVTYTYFTDEECTKKTAKSDGAAADGKVPAKAGTYYVQAVAAETAGYEGDSAVAEFTIEKKSLTYEWGDLNFTYNGKEQIPSAAPVNLVNGDQIDLIISGGATAAGEHEATVEGMDGAMSANYELPEVRTQTYKIAKKVAELTWGGTSFIYSGKDQIPTVSVTNLEQGDECELTVTGAATAVGTHKATVVKLSNDNYELPDEIEKEFTIAKADLTDEARVIIDDWTYSENPSVPKVEGNIEGANVTYEYKAVEDEDSAYSTTVPSLAGRYTVRAIIDGTAGYNGKPVTADFTIKKAASAMITYPTAVTGLIYDGKAQALVNPGSAFGGTVYYALGQDDVNAPDGDAFTDEIPLGTDTGTYYVWFKVVGDANHNDCECGGVDVTIIPVTRDALIEKTKEAEDYYDDVVKDVEDYADVAAPLKEAIDEAWTVADDDNVTDEQIGAALRKVVNALERAIRKVNAPLYKIEEINQKRDRLVELLNTKGTDVVDGFYQSECDTVSVNYAVCNGKISRVMLDPEGIRDGYNYLTMNTGTSIILPDTYTISGNFADAKTAAKFIKSRGSIKSVLEPQKIKGVPTYELMLVNGSKKLVVSVIDVSLNAKVLRDVTLSVEVKRNTVSRNAVSANCISEYGYGENGGVITIATNPVFRDDSRGEKYDNARFLSGVWMVGNTAITRGVIQTVSCKEATVHAKVNSDGTLSIGKAEGSGGGTVPISYVLNGKMSVRKDRVVSKSKIYKAKIKVK